MEIRAAALSRGCFACRQSSPLREAHGRNMIAEAACGRSSLSEKAGCAGLFRQMHHMFALMNANSQPARRRKAACALRREGKRQPCGLLREAQSDPKVRRKEACALWALGPKAQSDLKA